MTFGVAFIAGGFTSLVYTELHEKEDPHSDSSLLAMIPTRSSQWLIVTQSFPLLQNVKSEHLPARVRERVSKKITTYPSTSEPSLSSCSLRAALPFSLYSPSGSLAYAFRRGSSSWLDISARGCSSQRHSSICYPLPSNPCLIRVWGNF